MPLCTSADCFSLCYRVTPSRHATHTQCAQKSLRHSSRATYSKMPFFRRVFFTGNGNVPLLDMYCNGHPSRIIQLPLFDFPPFPPTIGAKFGKRKMSSFFGLFSFLLPTWRLFFIFLGGSWGRGIMKTLKGGMYFWVGAHKTSFTLSSIYFTSWRRWEKAACVV